MLMQVTFLYELREGACPKSYGTACARLAGMPEPILAKAEHLAAQLESACLMRTDSAAHKQSNRTQPSGIATGLLKELGRCLRSGISCSDNQLVTLRKLQLQARRAMA